MERLKVDSTSSAAELHVAPHHSSSSVNKENQVFAFTQDECIEWDDGVNFDLQQVAESPKVPPTPATYSSQSNRPTPGALRQLQRSIVDSNSNRNIVVRRPKSRSPKVSTDKTDYNAEKEINKIFCELEKEEEEFHCTSSQPDVSSEAPTQRHENLRSDKPKPPATKPVEPQQFLATGVRLRKKRKGPIENRIEPSKRPHSEEVAARLLEMACRTRRPRSSAGPGFSLPAKTMLVGAERDMKTGSGTSSADFEDLLCQLDTDPKGKIHEIVTTRKTTTSDHSARTSTSNAPSSTPKTQRQTIPLNAHPPPSPFQSGHQKRQELALVDAPTTQELKSQQPKFHPTSCASLESQPLFVPLDHSKEQGQKSQNLALSALQSQTVSDPTHSKLHHPEEEKAQDEFGELPELSEADFAAMDAFACNVTQSTQKNADARPMEQAALIPTQSTNRGSGTAGSRTDKSSDTKAARADDFGDFPDFDFDSIDQQIAERDGSTNQASHIDMESLGASKEQTSSMSATRNFSSSSHVPPRDAPVRNPTFQTSNSGILYATFTRYKVLQVKDDTSTFTKTITVAKWHTSMTNEDDKAIHRSERDENSNALVLPMSSAPTIDRMAELSEAVVGYIFLRGEWYHTHLDAGDIIHLCSLSGAYRTDADALPIVLHTDSPPGSDINDDLVLVLHPDMLVTPTVISETISCSRRAVIRARVGSSGKMSRAALIGTMRHGLFERCMGSCNFTREAAKEFSQGIVRHFADSLVGCGMSDSEAEEEVIRILPQLQEFAKKYTALDVALRNKQIKSSCPSKPNPGGGGSGSIVEGHGMQVDINFVARSVQATEESAVSPELGLKGDIDVTVKAESQVLRRKETSRIRSDQGCCSPQQSLMGIELKTGHNQNPQNAHMAQLALYTLLLRIRHGSTDYQESKGENYASSQPSSNAAVGGSNGGMLLYLNHESYRAVHVSPIVNELKSLIGQRNVAASEMKRASRPRGIVLSYDNEGNKGPLTVNGLRQRLNLVVAPPTALPEVLSTAGSCARCYTNRECMMYARAEKSAVPSQGTTVLERTHDELLKHFTGHLNEDDIAYFREWDRLVDLEADACNHSPAEAWLLCSGDREKWSGKCISSLIFDENGSMMLNSAVSESSQENLAGFLNSTAIIKLDRAPESELTTPLSSLRIEHGNHAIISTDSSTTGLSLPHFSRSNSQPRVFRHQMFVLRGVLVHIEESSVHIRTSLGELERMKKLTANFRAEKHALEGTSEEHGMSSNSHRLKFRLDKDEVSTGTGTLRQNLINLFTGDADQFLVKNGEKRSSDSSTQSEDATGKSPLRRRMSWLRATVVQLRPPAFDPRLAKSMFHGIPTALSRDLKAEFLLLNPDQQNAVEKVMSAKDYSLIQGMPGTGKTSTIAFVARLLAANGKRVLVSSFTHAAVDNLMLKLMEKGLHLNSSNSLPALVRLGQKSKCHPGVHSVLVDNEASALETELGRYKGSMNMQEPPTAGSLSKVMSSAKIVGVTSLSIPRSSLLSGQHFDVVIVDEAGQISQPAILGALMAADSFILVGDHLQLPPLVVSSVAEQGGYGVSMLKRLADRFPDSVAQLTLQYRMNGDICSLCNDIVYNGKLRCANSHVLSQRLPLSGFPSALPLPLDGQSEQFTTGWLAKVIDPSRPVIFVNTDTTTGEHEPLECCSSASQGEGSNRVGLESTLGSRSGGSVVNFTEIELVRYLVHGFTRCGLQEKSIGVISPFRAQLRLFDDCPSFVHWKCSGLEVSTIDRFQGRDKPLIILSFVRSNTKGKSGRLLEDFRRLNVAVSRAKMKLIMVGSFDTLHKGSSVLRPVLEGLKQRNLVESLPDDALRLYQIPT